MDVSRLSEESSRLRKHSRAKLTLRIYCFAWMQFVNWCELVGRKSLPATIETVTLYLTDRLMKGKKPPTVTRDAAAINYYHRESGHPAPADVEARAILAGARRLQDHQPAQKSPLLIEQLRAICKKSWEDQSPKGIRNHAILTFGFASALRRSNLVSLQFADVKFVPQGLRVYIRKEKQDQEGKGRRIGIVRGKHLETCAVRAVERWIEVRGKEPGNLFVPLRGPFRQLNPEVIALVVKAAVRKIGLDPKAFAGHSLRSGFVTEALENGVGELVVAKQSGHRSLDSLRRYYRANDLFRANPSSMIDL